VRSPPVSRERLLNLLLFVLFGWGFVLGLGRRLVTGLTAVDVSFILQNAVFCLVILLRRPEREMSRSLFGQFLALAAFFSGMAFMTVDPAEPGPAAGPGRAVMVAANVLAAAALVNLGRSFGILIAIRRLKTGGLYGLVRHPMYFSDILLRLGFLLVRPSPGVAVLCLASVLLYAGRALWEEKFLSLRDDYALYMKKVRWRFVPFVF
jgi:protein-S-isoprenylcysteine O-methyltransferase Ste14